MNTLYCVEKCPIKKYINKCFQQRTDLFKQPEIINDKMINILFKIEQE